jgi:hypothetical protein
LVSPKGVGEAVDPKTTRDRFSARAGGGEEDLNERAKIVPFVIQLTLIATTSTIYNGK